MRDDKIFQPAGKQQPRRDPAGPPGSRLHQKTGWMETARRIAAPSIAVDQPIGSGTEVTPCPVEPKPGSSS